MLTSALRRAAAGAAAAGVAALTLSASVSSDNGLSFAVAGATAQAVQPSLCEELDALRDREAEMRERWRRDDEGWQRKLPARAWPPRQPDADKLEGLELAWQEKCLNGMSSSCEDAPSEEQLSVPTYDGGRMGLSRGDDGKASQRSCHQLHFDIATTLVFNTLDPQRGLDMYISMAEAELQNKNNSTEEKRVSVDAMVAAGIILVEGLGVEENALEGTRWIKEAVARGSKQACFELGTLYYTGNSSAGIEEDERKAYSLFSKAAESGHVGATFMKADCLIDGIGVEHANPAAAVGLMYTAAERGHRFARQRILELLDETK